MGTDHETRTFPELAVGSEVCCGSNASFWTPASHVRYTPVNGHGQSGPAGPFGAILGSRTKKARRTGRAFCPSMSGQSVLRDDRATEAIVDAGGHNVQILADVADKKGVRVDLIDELVEGQVAATKKGMIVLDRE